MRHFDSLQVRHASMLGTQTDFSLILKYSSLEVTTDIFEHLVAANKDTTNRCMSPSENDMRSFDPIILEEDNILQNKYSLFFVTG